MTGPELVLTGAELLAEHTGRGGYVRQATTCDSSNGPLTCDLAAGHGGPHLDRRSSGTWFDGWGRAEQEAGK